mmetsp:Transcript_20382/g.38761  ORF Transcript_20382/g.38761 Transcript_20382/m.38761 type:complete len:93 (+) Transcript_20382:2164-2442(+)
MTFVIFETSHQNTCGKSPHASICKHALPHTSVCFLCIRKACHRAESVHLGFWHRAALLWEAGLGFAGEADARSQLNEPSPIFFLETFTFEQE